MDKIINFKSNINNKHDYRDNFFKKYAYRVKELQEMKNALNIFMTKIKFTYEPIPSTFMYISER